MQRRSSAEIACAFVALVMACFIPLVGAQDNSHANPAPKGAAVKSIVEIGAVAASNYDVSVTLLETLRGKEALDRILAASPTNKPPAAGFEYVLARVQFELKGRSASDNRSFDLGSSPFQWVALSADFRQYDAAEVAVPKPELKGAARPGETVQGWLAFAVEQKDSKPILTFDPASGGATGRGRTLFFRLY